LNLLFAERQYQVKVIFSHFPDFTFL